MVEDDRRAQGRDGRIAASLREYEADVEASEVRGSPVADMQVFRPFGPLIARVRAPPEIVDKINQFVDDFVAKHGDPARDDTTSLTIGTFQLPPSFVFDGGDRSLATYLAGRVAEYVTQAESPHQGEVRFEAFWVVRQAERCFSPVHFHSTDVAGVLYLKVPPAMRAATASAPGGKNYITARRAGNITFLSEGRQHYSKSYISFQPEVGDLLLSPGWLLHAVEPFDGPGERRSMAFNALVK